MRASEWQIASRQIVPITRANAAINASGFEYGPKVITG